MSARAKDKDAAFMVMDGLTSDRAAIDRAKLAHVVVPNPHAYDDPAVANDPVVAVFRAQLAHTIALPRSAAMRMVWEPYKNALGEVLTGRAEPDTQLRAVEREVRRYLDGPAR